MKHPKCNTNLPLYLITGCWQWLWFKVAANYSHSFEYVCSPKTVHTFKALCMLKCLSKCKCNLIFFPCDSLQSLRAVWWIAQWPLGMVTMGFFLLSCGKLLLNQRQRKLHTSGCYICYIKAVSATSRVTSGPTKGLRWRSHLSGILFQLDRKPWQNSTRENLPYCPLCPSIMAFYQFLWIHLWNTIQRAECSPLHGEVPTGAAQEMLREVPEPKPWCPLDGG